MEKKSMVKQSSTLKTALKERIKELGLNYTQIAEDAKKFNITNVKVETISRYFSGTQRGSLNEEGILFLAFRYCVPVSLNVGNLKADGDKVIREVPPYNEEKAMKMVKQFWDEKQIDEPAVSEDPK